MDGDHTVLLAKDAIDTAFRLFYEYFPRSAAMKRVLLEGLEFDSEEQLWVVKIGFEVGRVKETRAMLNFGPTTSEPIREIREFHLNAADGALVRMK